MTVPCKECRNLIMSHLDHALSSDERELLESHVSTCSQCSEILHSLQGITHVLETAPQLEPPEGIEELVMAQVRLLQEPTTENVDNVLKAVYGTMTVSALILAWAATSGLNEAGAFDILLQAARGLYVFVEKAWNLQVVYHLLASMFSRGIYSLVSSIQAVYVLAGLAVIIAGIKKLVLPGPVFPHTKI